MLKKISSVTAEATAGTAVAAHSGLRALFGAFATFCLAALLLPATAQAQDIELDPNFRPTAGLGVTSVAALPDGKYLVGGQFLGIDGHQYRRLARLNANGTVDMSFTNLAVDAEVTVIRRHGNHIYAGGYFISIAGAARPYLFRMHLNGTLDSSFQPLTGLNTALGNAGVNDLVVQPDGKIVIVGSFAPDNDPNTVSPPARIARINSDGSIDTTFTPPAIERAPESVARQSTGKLILGGAFRASEAPRPYLMRLHSDGTFDTDFANPGLNQPVYRVHVQEDDKVVIAGAFDVVHGQARTEVARLHANGTLDNSFVSPGLNGDAGGARVLAIVPHEDGWLIGGDFVGLNGQPRRNFARLNADGSFDASVGNPVFNNDLVQILPLPNRRVLVTGWFTMAMGQNRYRIAMLRLPDNVLFADGFE